MSGQTPQPVFDEESVTIVGVGLIGGSIAAALKKRGYEGRIVGVGRNASRLEDARKAGLLDVTSADPAAERRFVVFCTPVDVMPGQIREAAAACSPGTLITDAGSVKGPICGELRDQLPDGVTFIGSHPLAGSEKQGFEHADAGLFEGSVCVITPEADSPAEQLDRVISFWIFLGCGVVRMSAGEHDRALATTSHLPHVAAAALAAILPDADARLAASGFRDTTRIASGDPPLWTGILLANADAVVRSIDACTAELAGFRDAIANQDPAGLQKLLETAKTKRDALNGDGVTR